MNENGDFTYVTTALKANREGIKLRFELSAAQGTGTVGNEEAFTMLQMSCKMNTLLITTINRNMHYEEELDK